MRVISGALKGTKLNTLEGNDIRPTSDRVKEGLFNTIQFDLQNVKALDLFAGSGQLGIEALSRGASDCVFVDSSPDAIKMIKKNLITCKLTERAEVVTQNAIKYLKQTEKKFDIVFLDAPYHKGLLPKTLAALEGKLSSGATVICEHQDNEEPLPKIISGLSLYKIYKYGKIRIVKYCFKAIE